MSATLAADLKAQTRALHHSAERSRYMGELLRGRLSRSDYSLLLRSLYEIYAALEAGLTEHAADPRVAPLVWPALFRQTALAQDLVQLEGPGWVEALAVQPAALRHAERLHRLARDSPARLVAHAYVRYLGDLNGGQQMARIVERMLALPAAVATRFYDFGEPAEIARHIEAFRAALTRLDSDAQTDAALVDEAKLAFELHLSLFDELAGQCGLSPEPVLPPSIAAQ